MMPLSRPAPLAASVFALLSAVTGSAAAAVSLDEVAERYVRLVLRLGELDPGFVDAYYGPPDWRTEAGAAPGTLAGIAAESGRLAAATAARPAAPDPMVELRRRYLATQLRAVAARASMLGGARYSLDEETRLLYGAVSPRREVAEFQAVLGEIDALLPGDDPLPERIDRFRRRFEIPADRLVAVFDAAIAECRARTVAHVVLPADESFRVVFVEDRPWAAYNWYQGDVHSLIEVNTDLPVRIDRAVDLGCHEGYPGHHAYNVLLEARLVRERGWPEFSVYALYSPQSLIAEGSANYGQDVAFPGEERIEFERRVLFPLAGLDASEADTYYALEALIQQLGYVTNEVARRYLDGEIDRAEARRWLVDYQLQSPEAAEQGLRFIERYRGYVINYNVGKSMVRAWVEGRAPEGDPAARWAAFVELLSTPRQPGDLE